MFALEQQIDEVEKSVNRDDSNDGRIALIVTIQTIQTIVMSLKIVTMRMIMTFGDDSDDRGLTFSNEKCNEIRVIINNTKTRPYTLIFFCKHAVYKHARLRFFKK